MLISVFLLALPALVASNCDVMCSKSKTQLVREGDCMCSPGYPGAYKKGDYCTFRLTLNKSKRVRLEPEKFRLRYGGQCSTDSFKFENMYNMKKEGHWMDTVCKKDQMHGDPKSIIINSPQVRMKFRADKKGKKTSNRKWKLCLKPRRNPEIKQQMECNTTMSDFTVGFNSRTVKLANADQAIVTKVCCKSMDMANVDQTKLMCIDEDDESGPVVSISSNNAEVCVLCNFMKKSFGVETSVVTKADKKKISCSCDTVDGVSIGDDCTGDLPCIDTKDLAMCDAVTNLCECPDGYVVSNDGFYCTTNSNLLEDCSDGQNCVSKYSRAECNGTTCVCPSGFDTADIGLRQATADSRCTKDVAIGEDCTGELTCIDSLNRATCNPDTNLCECPSGTVPSPDNSYCTYDSGFDAFCEFDLDCTETRSMLCNTDTNLCECESPFVEYNSKCSYKSNLGGACASTSVDCVVSNSKCSSSECVCKSNDYKASGSTKCNAVCLQKSGKQIDKGKKVCNKRFKSGTCFLCDCNNPIKSMKQLNKKGSCSKISTCKKSSTIKTSVMSGSNCGE